MPSSTPRTSPRRGSNAPVDQREQRGFAIAAPRGLEGLADQDADRIKNITPVTLVGALAAAPGDIVHVRKLGPDGAERLSWTSSVLDADPSRLVLRSEFAAPRVELGCVVLRRGDVRIEFYSWRRWYTVAQVSAPDGTLRGWYCDVCAPPRWRAPASRANAGELSYVDLELDLWRGADGAIALLDEDEFDARREAGGFTPAQVRGAERGWLELRSLAERDTLPRWP